MLGEEHVSTSSSSLCPTSGIRGLGLCHTCLSGGCLLERLGSLGLRIPPGSVHPEDYSEAFAYGKETFLVQERGSFLVSCSRLKFEMKC